jgi:hypothetical protein
VLNHLKLKLSGYRPGLVQTVGTDIARPCVAQRVGRGLALLFHDRGIRRDERSAAHPNRYLPPGKKLYPLYRKLGGPQGQSGRVRKNLAQPGCDPRTVQPVVSRYTD